MKNALFAIAIVLTLPALAQAQGPDPLAIQTALNESLELEYTFFQESVDVEIVRGGETAEGDYLFLCNARLVWKMSSDQFMQLMQEGIDSQIRLLDEAGIGFDGLMPAFLAKMSRAGSFQQGDTVTGLRFRVRLEQAGADWIVTHAKIRETTPNPLNLFDD
jgi:hypothetical protein